MAISKVVYGGNTLIDLTEDTITENDLKEGVTAHGADGEEIVGALVESLYKSGIYMDDDGYIHVSSDEAAGGVIYKYGRLIFASSQDVYTDTMCSITENYVNVRSSNLVDDILTGGALDISLNSICSDGSEGEITSVTVTMGGIDITDQAFIPDTDGGGGISINDVPNATGITAAIVSGGSGGGSTATLHEIYLEFTDETDTTIPVYYDDSFISTMITAYTPTTYGQKTVSIAELDGVAWYTKPTEVWETIFNDNIVYYPEDDPTAPPYCWLSTLGDVTITRNSVWRVTFDSVVYSPLTASNTIDGTNYIIGNTLYTPGGQDDGSGVPFAYYSTNWGAWVGNADVPNNSVIPVKIERLVSS